VGSSWRYTVETLRMTGGLIVWGVHLGAVYAWSGLLCARGWDAEQLLGVPAVPFGIAAATLPALAGAALLLALTLRDLRRGDDPPGSGRRIASGIGAWAAAFALVGVCWTALPALTVVPACG
jgi:hypothetical protein